MSELLGANTDVLERSAESLSIDARRIADIRILAQRVLGELQASWNGSDLVRLTQRWEQQASPLLDGASASLDTCAARLRAQAAAQRVTSSNDGGNNAGGSSGGATALMPVTSLVSPPVHGSPVDNAAWWRSLSPLEQQQVIRGHPEWIGSRDGVDFTARDLANRAMLTVDRDHLVAERERLRAGLAASWFGGAVTNDDAALDHVKDKLASIDAVEATLAQPGEHQLLLLDTGQERSQAAIANGNVQTAANVAVFIPGMGTTVANSMKGSDTDMHDLQLTALRASSKGHPTHPTRESTTATVTWIGYQAPARLLDVSNLDNSGAVDTTARKGAAQLVPFLQGIGAARDHDAHLTLLGHSYGSTTAGLALRQETGVDDAVFFGSPGLGTDHVEDLRLAPGHAYYIEAPGDVVGDLGIFGADPSSVSGMKHLSTAASDVVDPATGAISHLDGVTGHSSYLLDGSTSQRNIATIVAGGAGSTDLHPR